MTLTLMKKYFPKWKQRIIKFQIKYRCSTDILEIMHSDRNWLSEIPDINFKIIFSPNAGKYRPEKKTDLTEFFEG